MSEEFIMDFKTEELEEQDMFSPVFTVDDLNSNTSTITATETNDSRLHTPTPTLLCKLKRCRVLLKRLPNDILGKHGNKNKRRATSAHMTPARSSKRLGPKMLPGKYLALHVNKPLKDVLEKKTKKSKQLHKSVSLTHKTISNSVHQTNTKKELTNYAHAQQSQRQNDNLMQSNKKSRLTDQIFSNSNQPIVTKYSDVIITKYPLPTSPNRTMQVSTKHEHTLLPFKKPICSTQNKENTSATVSCTLPSSRFYLTEQTGEHWKPVSECQTSNTNLAVTTTATVALKSNVSNQYVIHKFNITDEAIAKPGGNDNRPQQLISIFPIDNAPPSLNNTNPQQLADSTVSVSPVVTQQSKTSSQQNDLKNDAVLVNTAKVLVINQPALKNDPLNVPGVQSKNDSLTNDQSTINSDNELVDSDAEIIDNVNIPKSREPEVIKRIIYESKYAQTKFTCSGNICGIVDTNGFNLNCFYCYDIFPLHKWQQFKKHIKSVHHVEEDEMESNDESPPPSPIRLLTPTKERNKTPTDTKSLENCLDKQKISDNAEKPNSIDNSNKTLQSLSEVNDEGGNDDDEEDYAKFKDLIQNFSDEEGNNSFEAENENENEVKTNTPTSLDISNLLPPSLQHITIKKIKAGGCDSENSSKENTLEETFIKLPSNLDIQKVLKTIPKVTGHTNNKSGSKKPRYFVVKKVINPVSNDVKNNLNTSKNVVLKKVPPLKQWDDDDDMPSNDENEDPIPKPTNGCGILFGLTNRMVVIEFLLKLKTFPELWRPQLQKNSNIDYNESIKKICDHLNNRFMLDIKEFEIRLSIQRVKDWYCRVLKKMHVHNKTRADNEPYQHKFPVYFKILNQFLTSDVNYSNNLLSSRYKSDIDINNYPKWMYYKTDPSNFDEYTLKEDDPTSLEEQEQKPLMVYKATYPEPHPSGQSPSKTTTQHSNKISSTAANPSAQSNTPPNTPPTTPPFPELDDNTVIEFDADTLYGNESSSDEVLEEFDETRKKRGTTDFRPERKRTKVYLGHFACDMCSKVFKRRCDFNRHKVHHFPPKFECSVCSKKFYFQHWAERCSHIRKNILELNSNSETTEIDPSIRIKPKWPKKIFRFSLICETCGAAYRSIGSLNAHKRDKHLNQRLKCGVCNFTAITNYRIVQHQKKRHIVEPGTVEELAKKSRARTDSKTPFSVQARQEFDWRREMRKKLKPGEKFFGCCKCRIIFQTRKEKVLHNKTEHPIKETTVICLLCLPEKMLLSNSNSVRRHYTDIHKVPWDEIDALVKRTKPVFNFLTKEQIELLNASENYIELIKEMLKDTNLEVKKEEATADDIDEATKAILDLAKDDNVTDLNGEVVSKMEDDNVYIDGIIDHDYNNDYNEEEYNEHNYSEEQADSENQVEYYVEDNTDINANAHEQDHEHENFIQQQDINVVDDDYDVIKPMTYQVECHNKEEIQGEHEIINEFVEGQLVEECIVVEEECIDDVIDEDEYY